MSTLKHQLMRHEGFMALPYHCSAGKLTIGYGHNLENPISQKAAKQILMDDMLSARNDCFKVFPDLDTFSQGRQDAIINMMFNLGLTRFNGFKKMIKAIKERDWERAADEAYDSLWRKQVKGRASEIIEMIRQG